MQTYEKKRHIVKEKKQVKEQKLEAEKYQGMVQELVCFISILDRFISFLAFFQMFSFISYPRTSSKPNIFSGNSSMLIKTWTSSRQN